MEETKRPVGRPSTYRPETTLAICQRLATGESLRKICRDDDMPDMSTVIKWLSEHEEFSYQYARAREIQADTLADEILDIADTPLLGVTTKIKEDGATETTEGDMLQHRRLQVDARKWYASKLAPKKYGDKVQQEVSATVHQTSVQIQAEATPEQAAEAYTKMIG